MSSQQIALDVRHALWLSHKRKCVYCGEPLSFQEVDIDHVIPENLSGKSDLPAILKSLGLPEDFDLFATENLLPAHRKCNLAKGAEVFDPNTARFYLQRAKVVAGNVRQIVAAKKKVAQKDSLLVSISEAVRSGTITPMDLETTPNPNVLRLSKPLVFADDPDKPITAITPEEVERYLDRPVLIGGNPQFTADFGDDSGVRMTVHTCREYRAALAANFYAKTTYDIKSEAFLNATNSVLIAATSLRTPHVSYIRSPHRGVADLELLPASVLGAVGPDDHELLNQWTDFSLQDLLARGEIKILRISSTELSLEWRSGFMIREVCRADIDGDGLEDILCECYLWAISGTLGCGWTCVLSRTNENGKFSISRP